MFILQATSRYLMLESRAKLTDAIKMGIYNFLQKFVLIAHENGTLYEDFLTKNFFCFVKCMSFSNLRCVRHTGVIFGKYTE